MTPPKFDLVVEDCNTALSFDKKYLKALNRRAMAYEGLEKWEDALRDFTAATILDRFQNQGTANSVERVLKVLSAQKAKEIVEVWVCPLRLPPAKICSLRTVHRDCPHIPSFLRTSRLSDHASFVRCSVITLTK